ncbi:Nucleotide-binding universal stress protein, UspA family [Methylobacterium sp. ap11]|uniref:universal stress protein n=1 Tax=Methylobacterium sp. ap11 TaxID=1761799 RepID=UPI0008D3481A|nr:universal stress protein [Methylobacterium sp. ap11]SEP50315.1 Nucleotide-binding universal stress protein, UspA family [Methylobacterium sp. ap11]
MKLCSILVSVDLGPAGADRVQLAAGLAATHAARLVGVAACPVPATVPAGDGIVVERVYDAEDERARERLAAAEALFEREAGSVAKRIWRGSLSLPVATTAEQARTADLVIVGRHGPADGDPGPMAVPPGALLMEAGRPVLVAPPGLERLAAKRVVVAWKDTRETRRAVHDALPLIAGAERVCVVAAGPDAHHEGAEATAQYLSWHGLATTTHLLRNPALSVADEVLRFCEREGADLLVMGAYGHSRMREWVFGGVTRDVLRTTPLCCLMSH